MTDVRILVTGGKIDKVHNMQTEGLSFSPDGITHVPDILATGRCYHPTVEQLMLKDSLDFNDGDRSEILTAAELANECSIVVTHGTGTMDSTARFLAGKLPDKTVVLTGAMRPHSLFQSDGIFNLGAAIVAAQLLKPGVWAVMNGRVFHASELKKNTELGRFDV